MDIQPFLSRIIGSLIGGVAGYLSTKLNIVIDPATQASITAAVVIVVYSITHRVIDRHVNPGDVASPILVQPAVIQKAELKTVENLTPKV